MSTITQERPVETIEVDATPAAVRNDLRVGLGLIALVALGKLGWEAGELLVAALGR